MVLRVEAPVGQVHIRKVPSTALRAGCKARIVVTHKGQEVRGPVADPGASDGGHPWDSRTAMLLHLYKYIPDASAKIDAE